MPSARILAVCLASLLAAPLLSHAADEKGKAEPSTSEAIAHIRLTKSFPEKPQPTGFFGEQEDNLRALLARIDKAAEDKQVKALYLQIGGDGLGLGQINELRQAITKFKKSKKPVIAFMEEGTSGTYLLASSADEVIMPPAGWLLLTGLRMEVTMLKDLLDKVGVKADMLQMGDFKGAGEPLTRSKMSDEVRSQLGSVLDDNFAQLVETVAESRKLAPEKVKELIDQAPFTAENAKKAGLVDRVEYASDIRDRLAKEWKTRKVIFKMNYGRKNVEKDFEGLAGLMKLMQSLAGEPKTTASSFSLRPKIGLLYATGPIMTGKSEQGFGSSTLGSDSIIDSIREANQNGKVVAIVLRVDSPGGSALASDLIWHELAKVDKPFVVSMGDVAASGGYYISMGADKIFAEPGTLTGSIGVVGGKVALSGLFKKLGVNVETLSRGKNANILSMDDPFSDSERAAFTELLKETYAQFTSKAAEGRKMEPAKMEQLAGGRVWTGRQAKANGLVDELGTLDDAIVAAKKLANLKEDTIVDIEVFPKPPTILEALLGPSDETLPHDASTALRSIFPQLAERLSILEWLRPMMKEPILLMPSFHIDVH